MEQDRGEDRPEPRTASDPIISTDDERTRPDRTASGSRDCFGGGRGRRLRLKTSSRLEDPDRIITHEEGTQAGPEGGASLVAVPVGLAAQPDQLIGVRVTGRVEGREERASPAVSLSSSRAGIQSKSLGKRGGPIVSRSTCSRGPSSNCHVP